MSDYKSIKTEELTKIANAIRYKTGKSDKISLEAMAEEIREIESGVSLPELENEGAASDLLSGKELIDGEGNKVTGTFSIDSELSTQDDLIAQIQAAVDSLPEADEGGNNALNIATITVDVSYGTTLRYVGADGLATLYTGMVIGTSTIQVCIPSICFVQSSNNGASIFGQYGVSGGCSTLFNNQRYACIEITADDAEIVARSESGGSGGAD